MILQAPSHDKKKLFKIQENFETARKKEELARAHMEFKEMLTRYAYLRVHNVALSEDLVQETFLKTWKYIIKGGEVTAMRAFLCHILHGLIIDQYRKERFKTFSLDTLTDGGFDVPSDEHKHKGEAVDRDTALHYIDKLPTRYKDVLRLRIMSAMSIEEISEKLKRTKNCVKVQLHRGLKLIQELQVKSLKPKTLKKSTR